MIETLIWAWRAFRTTAAFRWLALAAGAVGAVLVYLSRRDARVRRDAEREALQDANERVEKGREAVQDGRDGGLSPDERVHRNDAAW